jgi:hypothetical protein
MLIRANDKRLSLANGQVLTVSGIAPNGALQTKEGLCVPADSAICEMIGSLMANRSHGVSKVREPP